MRTRFLAALTGVAMLQAIDMGAVHAATVYIEYMGNVLDTNQRDTNQTFKADFAFDLLTPGALTTNTSTTTAVNGGVAAGNNVASPTVSASVTLGSTVWVIPQQQQPPGQSFIGLISGFDNNVFTQQQHDAYDTTGNMYVWLAVADYDRILPSTIDQGFNFTLTNNSTYSGQFCEGQGLACFSLHPLTISESLTPFDSPSETPLPGALPLFATGLASLGVIGWRRKKSLAA